jgi:integrase
LLADLRMRQGSAARALEFLILTAARSGEVLRAVWDEIDFETATWTVPGKRMKSGREHRVPLSPQAIALLHNLPHEGNPRGLLFIGVRSGGGLGDCALANLLRRMRPGFTVHGMRSAFRDWCGERTATPVHIIELCLAHAVGSATERAYARSDLLEQRRNLMAAWAAFLDGQEDAAAVVPLRRRKA